MRNFFTVRLFRPVGYKKDSFCLTVWHLNVKKCVLGTKLEVIWTKISHLRLGFRSFASKLMDIDGLKVFAF